MKKKQQPKLLNCWCWNFGCLKIHAGRRNFKMIFQSRPRPMSCCALCFSKSTTQEQKECVGFVFQLFPKATSLQRLPNKDFITTIALRQLHGAAEMIIVEKLFLVLPPRTGPNNATCPENHQLYAGSLQSPDTNTQPGEPNPVLPSLDLRATFLCFRNFLITAKAKEGRIHCHNNAALISHTHAHTTPQPDQRLVSPWSRNVRGKIPSPFSGTF